MGRDSKKKEKRALTSGSDSDSGPEDREPVPKAQKKSLHKVSNADFTFMSPHS